MSEEKEIIIRTEEVNEILTSAPKWLYRWGISVIFILILVAVGLSYFIKYPSCITTPHLSRHAFAEICFKFCVPKLISPVVAS